MAYENHWLPGFNFNVEQWFEGDRYETPTSIVALSSEECCRGLNALGQCPLFAAQNRFATFGNPVPFFREHLQSLLIGWLRERRCEASAIGSELSV